MWAHRALAICSLWKIYTCLFAPKCTRTLVLTRSKKRLHRKSRQFKTLTACVLHLICTCVTTLHSCYNIAPVLHEKCNCFQPVWHAIFLHIYYSTNQKAFYTLKMTSKWLPCPSLFHPLHPNASLHMLHTLLQTFPRVLIKRICLTIKSFFSWWSFPLIWWP